MSDYMTEQIAYYRARAAEYDQWFQRQGRYDRGEENNKRWFAEVETLRQALRSFRPQGDVLELACGTGLWTEQLVGTAKHITAVDAAAEMIKINQERLKSPKVQYIQANIFDWQPGEQYDVIFFAFWLSHVPPEQFEDFWRRVAKALRPSGRAFFVDSLYERTSTASNHQLPNRETNVTTRRLNDGREYNIVKVFYQAEQLANRLRGLGWRVTVNETPHYFLYGYGGR